MFGWIVLLFRLVTYLQGIMWMIFFVYGITTLTSVTRIGQIFLSLMFINGAIFLFLSLLDLNHFYNKVFIFLFLFINFMMTITDQFGFFDLLIGALIAITIFTIVLLSNLTLLEIVEININEKGWDDYEGKENNS